MVGQRVLVPSIGVRVPIPEPIIKRSTSPEVLLFIIDFGMGLEQAAVSKGPLSRVAPQSNAAEVRLAFCTAQGYEPVRDGGLVVGAMINNLFFV